MPKPVTADEGAHPGRQPDLRKKPRRPVTPTIKDPYVLDFLDLPEAPALHESQIESAAYLSLKDIFTFYGTGIQTSRNNFATDLDRPVLEARMRRFFDRTASDKQVAEAFELTDTRGWRISDERWPMRIDLGRDRR